MTEHETRLSRREAERLLDAPATHDSALGWALSAASAPAHPIELRREDATVAAFHSSRLSPPPARRRSFVSPTRLGSRAAIHAVVATGAVVAMASGGFALAGSLDLPSLPGQASDRATEAVSKSRGASETAGSPTGTPSRSASGTPTKARPTAKPPTSPSATSGETTAETTDGTTDEPTASPTPHLTGLCTAYQATDRSDNGKSLDSAAFTALAAAAGGADQIATFCVDLIGAPETEKPTPTGKPTDKPTGKPTDKPTPTGTPTDKPTGSPTDKPSPGKPTDKPDQSGDGGGKDSTTSGS